MTTTTAKITTTTTKSTTTTNNGDYNLRYPDKVMSFYIGKLIFWFTKIEGHKSGFLFSPNLSTFGFKKTNLLI